MSKVCAICGKKAISINQVSHANNKTLRRSEPNLRVVKGKRVCAKCVKAGKTKNMR